MAAVLGWLLLKDSGDTRPRLVSPANNGSQEARRRLAAPETARITWNPMAKQRVEPDTLFLFDADGERTRRPGDGGFIMGNAAAGDVPWRPDSKIAAAPGRYRTGIVSRDPNYGYMWMPASGLLPPREFTVELWLKSARPWREITGESPFGVLTGGAEGTWLDVRGGKLNLIYSHLQGAAGPVRATLSTDVSTVRANQWVNIAFTLRDGTLTLYRDGAKVAEERGVQPIQVVSDNARGDGLSVGGLAGKGATSFTVSDIRISARARMPHRAVDVPRRATMLIDPRRRTGASVQQLLAGGLHTLGGPASEKVARGLLTALRTDKLLTATPIKAGSPDATHPTRGVSGRFSYDWRVVDRTFDDFRRLRVLPYISIDATPQILGGSVPPFTGEMLRRGRPFQAGFPGEVPRDLHAFGNVVRDLVHHVVIDRRLRVPYWGVWNEPDGGVFWKGGLDDYLRLYDVVARSVKSVDPKLLVGGPESGAWNPTWAEALIRHAASHKVLLDFFSWHYYSGNLGELVTVSQRIKAIAREVGMRPRPRLLVGEWSWANANLPGTGARPWAQRNYFVNDWAAAFAASSLIEMQRLGVAMAIYTNPVAEPGGQGYAGSGLVSSRGPWATGNAVRLWRMLGPSIVTSQLDAPPGVAALSSRNRAGQLTVLVTRLQYRPGPAVPLEIELPAGTRARRVLYHYVIDAKHSDGYDAGPRRAALQTVPDRQAGRRLVVSVPPRSVQLLVIDVGS
jgi:hypothetical protein